jgi:hypothetical protein
MKNNDTLYDVSTPELAKLFAEMNAANDLLAPVAKKYGIEAVRRPEYKAAMKAYRAYWKAVDGNEHGPAY